MNRSSSLASRAAIAALSLLFLACEGAVGPAGADGGAGPEGPPGTSTGTLAGAVTNGLSGAALPDAAVRLTPAVLADFPTGATGEFTVEVPVGVYEVEIALAGFATHREAVSIVAGRTSEVTVALAPLAPVVVDAGDTVSAAPEASLGLAATVEIFDGSTVQGLEWTQVAGLPVVLSGAGTPTPTVTLPAPEAYKAALVAGLLVPRRPAVLGVNPHALAEVATATLQVTVTTTSGAYADSVDLVVDLPLAVSRGVASVPVDVPVLVQSAEAASYAWTLATPASSAASLDDPTSPFPTFVPDLPGTYVLSEAGGGTTLAVHAGTWMGAITDLTPEGAPIPGNCLVCHDGSPGPLLPQFDAWAGSGHASILVQNVEDPGHHWSVAACARCHAVGHDPGAVNGGFDEAVAEEGWAVASPGYPGAFADMLQGFPESAALANVQCDGCHGPSGSGTGLSVAHGDGSARVSLDAAVCGSCHGEPPRHGRYQQWQRSGHGSFPGTLEVAVLNGHCARCHSAQGFLAWLRQGEDLGDLTQRLQGATGNATIDELAAMGLTAAEIQPVTCAACHDPHGAGTLSGEPNTALVRVVDETPLLPSGYRVVGAGRGALCMTCHNSRNGRHDDGVVPTSHSTPHHSSQADVLLGQNAYFVTPGLRGSHSFLGDTCATCHMERTPPPADLSYYGAGTNHAFAADPHLCTDCHGAFDGGVIQEAFTGELRGLEGALGASVAGTLDGLGGILVRAWDPATDLYSSTSATESNVTLSLGTAAPDCGGGQNRVDAARVVESHGQMALELQLACPVEITWTDASVTSTAAVTVELRSLKDGSAAVVYPPDSTLARAAWNYLLLAADGSEGVHNPSFATEVIAATKTQAF